MSSSQATVLILTTINGQFALERMFVLLEKLLRARYGDESQLNARLDEITTKQIKVVRIHDLEELCMVWGEDVSLSMQQLCFLMLSSD